MSGSPPSKLFIRSEVLSVVDALTALPNPPKQDRAKQLKRLSAISDRPAVLSILLKELQRASQPRTLQVLSELMMELGTIDTLHDPLWDVIRDGNVSDEVKDAANLILRHLGDESDPDLYLDYLQDPMGLINRETERMLAVSAHNPEALIDFIDFIFSLPADEQVNLLYSLQSDYQPEYLINLYIPALLADPPEEVKTLVLKSLGQIRTPKTVAFLLDLQERYADQDEKLRLIRRALQELRLAGLYSEERHEEFRNWQEEKHPLVEETTLHQCYATLPDGIGNQGLIISRRQPNGDLSLMCVAINDVRGIIDCFGFFQLSEEDFGRILQKFHEDASKIEVSAAYCQFRLQEAEARARRERTRIPYEYTCWKILLQDVPAEPLAALALCEGWADFRVSSMTSALYQHPDFATWFLEEGDDPRLHAPFKEVQDLASEIMAQGDWQTDSLLARLDAQASTISRMMLTTEWRDYLIQRLADAAYLLTCQKTPTFSQLAATEAIRLVRHPNPDDVVQDGFIRQYGRRCVEEELLRLRQSHPESEALRNAVQAVLEQWAV